MAWAIYDWAVPTLLLLTPSLLEAVVRIICNVLAYVLERPALVSRPWTSFTKLLEEEYGSLVGKSSADFSGTSAHC